MGITDWLLETLGASIINNQGKVTEIIHNFQTLDLYLCDCDVHFVLLPLDGLIR